MLATTAMLVDPQHVMIPFIDSRASGCLTPLDSAVGLPEMQSWERPEASAIPVTDIRRFADVSTCRADGGPCPTNKLVTVGLDILIAGGWRWWRSKKASVWGVHIVACTQWDNQLATLGAITLLTWVRRDPSFCPLRDRRG